MGVVQVLGLVASMAGVGWAVVNVRKPSRVRVKFDFARLAVSIATVLVFAGITGVHTSYPLIAAAGLIGVILGVAQGRTIEVWPVEAAVFAKRTATGIAVWGAGMFVMQAAGMANRTGAVRLGQAGAYLSIALTVGVLIGRQGRVDAARATATRAAVVTFGIVLLAIAAPFVVANRSAEAQADDPPLLGTGDVQVSLSWTGVADLDLHVIEPEGEELFYQHQYSRNAGQLDYDDVPGCSASPELWVENVFWPTGKSPTGPYRAFVRNFDGCDGGSQSFILEVRIKGDLVARDAGSLAHKEDSSTLSFRLDEAAGGVVLGDLSGGESLDADPVDVTGSGAQQTAVDAEGNVVDADGNIVTGPVDDENDVSDSESAAGNAAVAVGGVLLGALTAAEALGGTTGGGDETSPSEPPVDGPPEPVGSSPEPDEYLTEEERAAQRRERFDRHASAARSSLVHAAQEEAENKRSALGQFMRNLFGAKPPPPPTFEQLVAAGDPDAVKIQGMIDKSARRNPTSDEFWEMNEAAWLANHRRGGANAEFAQGQHRAANMGEAGAMATPLILKAGAVAIGVPPQAMGGVGFAVGAGSNADKGPGAAIAHGVAEGLGDQLGAKVGQTLAASGAGRLGRLSAGFVGNTAIGTGQDAAHQAIDHGKVDLEKAVTSGLTSATASALVDGAQMGAEMPQVQRTLGGVVSVGGSGVEFRPGQTPSLETGGAPTAAMPESGPRSSLSPPGSETRLTGPPAAPGDTQVSGPATRLTGPPAAPGDTQVSGPATRLTGPPAAPDASSAGVAADVPGASAADSQRILDNMVQQPDSLGSAGPGVGSSPRVADHQGNVWVDNQRIGTVDGQGQFRNLDNEPVTLAETGLAQPVGYLESNPLPEGQLPVHNSLGERIGAVDRSGHVLDPDGSRALGPDGRPYGGAIDSDGRLVPYDGPELRDVPPEYQQTYSQGAPGHPNPDPGAPGALEDLNVKPRLPVLDESGSPTHLVEPGQREIRYDSNGNPTFVQHQFPTQANRMDDVSLRGAGPNPHGEPNLRMPAPEAFDTTTSATELTGEGAPSAVTDRRIDPSGRSPERHAAQVWDDLRADQHGVAVAPDGTPTVRVDGHGRVFTMDGTPVAGRLVGNSGKVLGVMGPDGVIRAPDGVTALEPSAGRSSFEPQMSLRDGRVIGYTGADGSTWSSDT